MHGRFLALMNVYHSHLGEDVLIYGFELYLAITAIYLMGGYRPCLNAQAASTSCGQRVFLAIGFMHENAEDTAIKLDIDYRGFKMRSSCAFVCVSALLVNSAFHRKNLYLSWKT